MKYISLTLFILCFFLTMADGVNCLAHAIDENQNVISFVNNLDNDYSSKQSDFSPVEHCGVCPVSCTIFMTHVLGNDLLIFSHSLRTKNDNFHYKSLILKTYHPVNERPPTFA